ncbi:MAG: 50S ribosomal protein L11 methyltransferase [Pyrinomonadaceae bacterium]
MKESNKETWLALEIAVAPEAAEAVELALNSVNALGTAISFRRVNQTEALTVTGYFNEFPDDQILQDELHYALRSCDLDEEAIHSIKRETIENTDWLAEWKKHWKPTTVGRFVIAPSWFEVDEPEKIVIRIEPNMAFGTGTHETTQLCLAEIDKHFQPGESFLDVGTGTGILAIAAAKLGASDIFACDTDVDAITIARENAQSNGAPAIEFSTDAISSETAAYDFICANLTIDVIQPMLDLLLSKSKRVLVISGILGDQEPIITSALNERGITGHRVERLGEWISVTVTR